MISAILLPLAMLSPADTPIEPIPVALIQVGLDAGLMQGSCDAYGTALPLLARALDNDLSLATDVIDAYMLQLVEEEWEPEGSALTLEAEEALLSYFHDCA